MNYEVVTLPLLFSVETERREPKDTVQGDGAGRKKTAGKCSWMVGEEQHGDIESRTGGAWCVNTQQQGDLIGTWWCNDEVKAVWVKDAITAKKEARKKWGASGRQEEIDSYRQANKEANKVVTRSKVHSMGKAH